jgi:hypothetical protein
MGIEATPDFADPLVDQGVTVLYPFQSGPCTVYPDGLDLATSVDGKPLFSLELVRGAQEYGVLDLTLTARFRADDALAMVRAKRATVSVQHAQFTSGVFRWRPRLESEMPPGFLEPQPLVWNGLGICRFILKLSKDAGLLVRDALADETFILDATVDVEVEGVAPRVPVRVRFTSNDLLAQFRRGGAPVAYDDVVRGLLDPTSLPLHVDGVLAPGQNVAFAQAMADRVRARFGRFVAAPSEDLSPHFALPAEGETASGAFEWDLSEPLVVKRGLTLRMHPLALIRDAVRQSGIDSISRITTVPPLPLGQHNISVLFNLARTQAVNIAAAGATVKAPPVPPQRFQAVTASAEVRPPVSTTTVRLKLSPAEALKYQCTTWSALSTTTGIFRYDAPAFDAADELLTLGPTELPFRLVSVGVDPSVLELAHVDGTVSWDEEQKTRTVAFAIETSAPAVDVAIPSKAQKPRLALTLREVTGSGVLTMSPPIVDAVQIGLYSFREFGPQEVALTLQPAAGQPSLILELLSESEPESAAERVMLSSQVPTRVWRYFAASPFRCGYRYRIRPGLALPPGPWSDVRQPFEPLVLAAATAG